MSRISDLIHKLCPDGVPYIELQALFDIHNGYTPSKADEANWTNGSVPWFRMEDIRKNGRILEDSIHHISQAAVKGNRVFPANSLIVATLATIGEHAMITGSALSQPAIDIASVKTDARQYRRYQVRLLLLFHS